MKTKEVKVAAIQAKAFYADKNELVDNNIFLLENAGKNNVKICCLCELFFMEYDRFLNREHSSYKKMYHFAESIDGPTINKITKIAKSYGMFIIAPIFEKSDHGVYYNSAPVIGPDGRILGVTRKLHIPAIKSLEKLYFRPGSKFNIYNTPWGKFGIGICYDRRFPELARILSLKGCEIYFNPMVGGDYVKSTHELIGRMRSVDNCIYTVIANRCGNEGNTHCFGHSIICDPWGNIVANGKDGENIVVSATIDLENIDKARIETGIFRDLRPNLYYKYYKNSEK